MTNRREFIASLGGAAAWPLTAWAQRRPVIGFLWSRSPGDDPQLVAAFREGLKQVGYIEGQTSLLITALRRINTIGCRLLQPIWFVAK
jgi:hypothetical protein